MARLHAAVARRNGNEAVHTRLKLCAELFVIAVTRHVTVMADPSATSVAQQPQPHSFVKLVIPGTQVSKKDKRAFGGATGNVVATRLVVVAGRAADANRNGLGDVTAPVVVLHPEAIHAHLGEVQIEGELAGSRRITGAAAVARVTSHRAASSVHHRPSIVTVEEDSALRLRRLDGDDVSARRGMFPSPPAVRWRRS